MSTDERQQVVGGISRRSLLRGGLLAGAGVATLGTASAILTRTAKANTPNPQLGWAWCAWCGTMFWPEAGFWGLCAAPQSTTGNHWLKSGTSDYELSNDLGGNGPNPQPNWNWCARCMGLFWGPGNSRYGSCLGHPAGTDTSHFAGSSTSYYLYSSAQPQSQPYWRWCGFCDLLFWGGSSSGLQAGYCPGRNNHWPHVASSDTNYYIQHNGTH
jgi:hypothetical protein